MKEKELIQKCKENDYKAQLEVYNRYKNALYNVSYRIVGRQHDAEDLLQESFLKGFNKIHLIKENVSLEAWLKRIAINTSLDFVRKRKREQWVEETEVLNTDLEEDEIDDFSEYSIDLIKECLNNLKEKYRIVLVLYMIEDYNHREISEMLNLKESTVRNQYVRGKNLLIEMIKNARKNEFKEVYPGA